jgi:hypothetical protein
MDVRRKDLDRFSIRSPKGELEASICGVRGSSQWFTMAKPFHDLLMRDSDPCKIQ